MKSYNFLIVFCLLTLSLFSFSFIFNQKAASLLFTDNLIMNIDFIETNDNSSLIFVNHLKEFSIIEGVNISQYNFLNENTLNIYSTNLSKDPNVHLESGSWPESENYISNLNENNIKKMGHVSFPISMWKVRYFDIDQIRNVGVGDTFYLSINDSTIKDRANKAFSIFGNVNFIDNIKINNMIFVNKTLFYLACFSLLVLSVNIFFYIYKSRKQLYLYELWGYGFIRSYYSILLQFIRSYLKLSIVFGVLLVLATLIFQQTHYFPTIFLVLVVIISFSILITACIVLFSVIFINNSTLSSVNLKGSPPFRNYQFVSLILKTVVAASLLYIVSSSITNVTTLKQQLGNISYWNKTQGIFRIQMKLPDTIGDLNKDRFINDKIATMYQLLKVNRHAFVINAQNFINLQPADKEPYLAYETNTQGEKQIFSTSGRRIDINENYLLINPIEAANGKEILNQINNSSNVMNILVPEKYKKYTSLILENYKEYFYFQKVQVSDMYNEEINKELSKASFNDLAVNIIYTKNNQQYFTYNSALGDPHDKNNILDPIAVIINDTLDTSNIKAFATSSLFFSDNSQGDAYNSIFNYLKNSNTHQYIHAVVSVYQEKNEMIVKLRNHLIQQIIAIIMMVTFSLTFLLIFIWSYYMNNANDIYLKYLFGYSYWKRNEILLLGVFLSNIASGIIVLFWLKTKTFISIPVVLIFIDFILIYLLNNYMNSRNSAKILKGDKI